MSLSLIIFLVIIALGVIATLFVDLSWGVCLYVLLYFIFPANRWWYTLPKFRFTLILGAILLIIYFFKQDEYKLSKLTNFPQAKWLLFMIFLMVTISFYSLWPEQHNKFLILQIKQLIFLILAYKIIDSSQKLQNVLISYFLGCSYIGYIAYYLGRDTSGRVEGIGMPDGSDANTTAAVLITAIPIIFYFLLKGKLWQRVISLLSLAFILNGIILINSRGAFLGLAIGMAYYFGSLFLRKLVSSRERLFILGIAVFSLILFVYLTDNTFWQRMDSLRGLNLETSERLVESGGTRIMFWLKSIDVAKQYPFGTGARGFEYLSPQLVAKEHLSIQTATRAAHSTYFEALTDFGFIAIPLLLGFIYSSFSIMRRSIKHLKLHMQSTPLALAVSLEASFVAFLVSISFINRLYAEAFYWLMLFIACFANVYFYLPEEQDKLTDNDENNSLTNENQLMR